MKIRSLLSTICLLTVGVSPVTAQQRDGDNPLSAARTLYASARYDEALAVLDGLALGAPGTDRKSVEQYRSLCLLALGRGSEAEAAIAAVITADPMFRPAEADASPRVRAAFSDVRQKLLPQIATARYAGAKAAYDRREFALAEQQFREALVLIDDPQMAGKLSDLRVLAAGFLELSAAAAAPPPEPEKEPEPPAPTPAPAPTADPAKVYSGEDANVRPPTVIRQNLPAVPPAIASQTRPQGILDVQIDERGRVTNLVLRIPVHPVYDQLLLGAAREWRYKPATFNGVPVKYRKVMQISVAKK